MSGIVVDLFAYAVERAGRSSADDGIVVGTRVARSLPPCFSGAYTGIVQVFILE